MVPPRFNRPQVRVEHWTADGRVAHCAVVDGNRVGHLKRSAAAAGNRLEVMPVDARAACLCGNLFDWSRAGLADLELHLEVPGPACLGPAGMTPDLARLRYRLAEEAE